MPKFSEIETANLKFYAPRYQVRVGGKDVVAEGAEVVSLSVKENLDAASQASCTILNAGLKWLKSPLFTPGAEVEIFIGYTEPLDMLFVGEITELKPTFPADGASQLEITCLDFYNRLDRGCRFQSWENKKDSDIVKEIAGRNKLDTSGIEQTTDVYPKIMQNGVSDLAFLKDPLAIRNKFEIGVRGRALIFAKPQDQASAPEVTTLKWGESLFSFSPELNTSGQITEVTVRGWNADAKKEIVGKATWKDLWGNQSNYQSGGELVEKLYGTVSECVRDKPVYTQEEAKTRALAVLKEKANTFLKGSGETIGIPQIRVRSSIVLEGLGPFSLKYYITGTTHSISSSGYKTSFNVKGDLYARSR